MTAWQRATAYGVAVAVVFAAALGIGRLVGPIETESADAHEAGHGSEHTHDEHAHGEQGEHGGDVAGASYELALDHRVLDSGRPQLAFRILDDAGQPVTSYDVQHERRLHLIAVRRDLAEFRHVHPRLDPATGRWTVTVALGAGVWRLYADFAPTGAEPTVAEADLMVAGRFTPSALGPDTTVSRVDGYEVHLQRDDEASTVTFHVTRDGADVTDLAPYLGAYGHLVAIRADDLAYLHVHPEDGEPGPEVGFHADLAGAGRYRLFLDFKHAGRVHTADFTVTVDGSEAHADDDHEGDDDDGGDHDH